MATLVSSRIDSDSKELFPGQCSAALRHPHQDHFLQFGLDKSLLYIEMAQIQPQLACLSQPSSGYMAWRG